jgi:hypothetical protein
MYVLNKDLKRPLLGIWNRLEPRPLHKDFSRVLAAAIYDPLWMLNRQWQFGEFKGEDTGSAVFSHLQLEHSKISRYAPSQQATAPVEVYSEAKPLEVQVESEGTPFDLKLQLQVSLYFKKLFQKSTVTFPTGLYQAFVQVYSLTLPSFNSLEEEVQHKAQAGSWLLWKTTASKGLLDGERLYQDLKGRLDNSLPISDLVTFPPLSTAEEQALTNLATALVSWLEKTYVEASSAWRAERLEYQFSNAVPTVGGNSHEVLAVEEHYQGKLDWYAYSIDNSTNNTALTNSSPLSGEDTQVYTESRTLLPAPVRFAGMPVPRWWEIEDGYINLGDLAQDTLDVPKVLLAQFGLVFNNDWQMVPIRRPIGSWSRVKSLVVTDVFGQKTAVTTSNNAENDWSLFSLEHKNSNQLDGRLFIPPTLDKILQGEPIEVVRFARDEMANQVWAIEQQIPSLMGEGMDGQRTSEAIKRQLAEALLAQVPVPPSRNLTAYYPLQGQAQEAQNFLHGTLYGTSTAIGPWGMANTGLLFAGNSNSYGRLPDSPLLKPSPQLTLSIWVKAASTAPQEQYIVFTANNISINTQAYALSIRNGKFRGYKNAEIIPDPNGGLSANAAIAVIDSSTTVQANTWYHVALTISTTQLQLYVNGNLEATTPATHYFDYQLGAKVIIGGTNEPNMNAPFKGAISELRFYNRALNGESIAQLYNNGQAFPVLSPQVASDSLQPADFIYHYLLNDVPENWIPFLPVRLPNSGELVLQRGKMQRNLAHLLEDMQYIQPQGVLLKEPTQNNSNLYFLKEEEVPRAGVTVTRRFQRTRWTNGEIFTWLGRQKKVGNGGINSNLQFDHLEMPDLDDT